MKAYRKTVIVCFCGICIFIIPVVFKILDDRINDTFYNISLALFTGLVVSLITTLSLYYNEKTSYIENTYQVLVLIYKELYFIDRISVQQKNFLKIGKFFEKTLYADITKIYTDSICNIKDKIKLNLYKDLVYKSKFKMWLDYISNIFIFDLNRVRKLSENIQYYSSQYMLILAQKQVMLEKTKQEKKDIDTYSFDIKLQEFIINLNENIGRQEELSCQLSLDIERIIKALRKLYKFAGSWEDEKNTIKVAFQNDLQMKS